MSDSLSSKSGTDVSSNSSWSIIEESESSGRSSLEKITIENDSDSQNVCENYQDVISVEDEPKENKDGDKAGFVSFDEFAQEEINKPEGEKSKKLKSQKCKNKKRRRKFKAEPLSIMSIAASVLTITGITLLCMVFSQNIEQDTLDKVQNNYIDIVNNRNANFEHYLNKTSEMFDIANEANLFDKIKETTATDEDYFTDEEVCPNNDDNNNESTKDFINFDTEAFKTSIPPLVNPFNNLVKNVEIPEDTKEKTESSSLHNFQNTTMALFKNFKEVMSSPQLHVFLCTILQDICLIRLLNQLNKYKTKKPQHTTLPIKPNSGRSTDSKNKKTKNSNTIKHKRSEKIVKENKRYKNKQLNLDEKLKKVCHPAKICTHENMFSIKTNIKPDLHIIEEFSKVNRNEIFTKNEKENGKSECERRFEDLDNKWESIGQIHRQKIQEIKEKFKNEVFLIKESETELSLRRQRIKLIRDKYVQRLRLDRERYLYQLRKLREEREKIMKELCHHKNNEINLKDASVGNYAILLPDTYDFQQRLRILRNKGNKSQVNLPTNNTNSYPKLSSLRTSKFIRYESIPNISKNTKNNTDTKNTTREPILNSNYLETLQKYSEMRNKYLEKKSMKNQKFNRTELNTKKIEESLEYPLVEDVISHMLTAVSDSKSKFYQSFSNSSVETVKENDKKKSKDEKLLPSDMEEASDQNTLDSENEVMNTAPEDNFKVVIRRKPRKQDIYDVAFNKKSKKIKHEDTVKWNHERREKFPPQQGLSLSKQNPEKSYKEKIVIKGLM